MVCTFAALCLLGFTSAQSTTYTLTLTGAHAQSSHRPVVRHGLSSRLVITREMVLVNVCTELVSSEVEAIAVCLPPAHACIHMLYFASWRIMQQVSYGVAGAANSPPISDPAVGQAFLAISFNTDSNNITYQLYADNITEVMAGHIHISPSVGANGSVSIPLYQAPYANLPGATTTGLLAASALTPAVFVGPYLEVLPNYANVPVSQVLSQYVQTGLAYAQVGAVALSLRPTFHMIYMVCSWPGTLGAHYIVPKKHSPKSVACVTSVVVMQFI